MKKKPIHGMSELTYILKTAPGKVLTETEKGLYKAAGIVKRAAQAKAPVGKGLSLRTRKAMAQVEGKKTGDIARGGRLRRNILVKRSRGYSKSEKINPDEARAVAVYVRFARQRGKWDAKNAWYAHFVEWGTKRTTAKPFLTPAWQAYEREAQRTIEEAGRKAVKKIGRSL